MSVSTNAALEAQINSLINQLYPPRQQGSAFSAFAGIKAAIASGQTASASAAVNAFAAMVMSAYNAGILVDPNGPQPPTIPQLIGQLFGAVRTLNSPGTPIVPLDEQLAVGAFHAYVIDSGGQTACWGWRTFGALGDGQASGVASRGVVSGNPAFTRIQSHGSHTCGMTALGATACWGRDGFGEALGNGSPSLSVTTPTVLTHGPYQQISGARLTSCALTSAGMVYCWGANQLGEVGDGTTTPRTTPVPVQTALTFSSIEASWLHSCALTSGGAAYCWGAWSGQLLQANKTLTPAAIPGGHIFSGLFAGGTHTCGITPTGETWCWGDNTSGQLGDGTTTGGGTPVQVQGGVSFVRIATGLTPNSGGASFTCGIDTVGAAYCWGLNDQGQLGDGSTTDRASPTPVLSTEVFVAIGAGDRTTCAMTVDRRVFCWGTNVDGELGSGTAGGFSSVPVQVP